MIKSFGKKKPKVHPTAFVSENAYLVGDIRIGKNSSVWPGAVLRADRFKIQIGSNCCIQDNCVIHAGVADVILGSNVIVGHGSVIHCSRIGNNVLIGMNTTLGIFAEIGDDCMIGAHSMVKDNFRIPPKSLAIGVPARIKRTVNRREMERIISGASFYVDLARDFKKGGL
jgi:carbonic anhydrase/acetyltransferase-like protein (isoleucine patch superfamily)